MREAEGQELSCLFFLCGTGDSGAPKKELYADYAGPKKGAPCNFLQFRGDFAQKGMSLQKPLSLTGHIGLPKKAAKFASNK
jgi:hypothetical protein